VRSHEDAGLFDELGQQATAGMRLVEDDDGTGEMAERPADGLQRGTGRLVLVHDELDTLAKRPRRDILLP